MKSPLHHLRREAGLTITEMMLTITVGSFMMGGLMAGSVALQRAFYASDLQATAENDTQRLADYIARDIRGATSINTTVDSSQVLRLTTADYYDRRGTVNTADDIPNSPGLGQNGATYGTSPLTIRYLKTGTRISRELSQVDAGVTTTRATWIADNVDTLTVTRDAQGIATVTATFATRYRVRPGGNQAPTSSFVMKVHPRVSVP